MLGFYVFSEVGDTKMYVARDGGLTPNINEADVTSEDVADDLSVWATEEFDMSFDIAEVVEDEE